MARRDVLVDGTDGINIWVPVHDESAAIVRLASRGIGVTPDVPFAVLPNTSPHIRVTFGPVKSDHADLAAELATAAKTTGWGSRAR
jgi:hypothetical protein